MGSKRLSNFTLKVNIKLGIYNIDISVRPVLLTVDDDPQCSLGY